MPIARIPKPRATRLISAAACLLLCASSASGSELRPAASRYEGKISIVPVRAEVSLEREEDGRWRYESVSRTRGWAAWKKGAIEETSRFVDEDGGARPLEYHKHDGFSDKDRDVETRFHADHVISRYRGEELRHAVAGPVYDLLTLRVVLRLDLAHDRLASRYDVVDGRGELRQIEVSRQGEESVRTGVGDMTAVRLEYSTRGDRRFVVWFAPQLDYELVRLEQYRDGKRRAWLVLQSNVAGTGAP